jgi:hypothetical protein
LYPPKKNSHFGNLVKSNLTNLEISPKLCKDSTIENIFNSQKSLFEKEEKVSLKKEKVVSRRNKFTLVQRHESMPLKMVFPVTMNNSKKMNLNKYLKTLENRKKLMKLDLNEILSKENEISDEEYAKKIEDDPCTFVKKESLCDQLNIYEESKDEDSKVYPKQEDSEGLNQSFLMNDKTNNQELFGCKSLKSSRSSFEKSSPFIQRMNK